MKNITFALLFVVISCTPQMRTNSFDVLGVLTEKALSKLLKVESLKQDSMVVRITVPRAHCRQVLGKRLNAFVTKQGECVLSKKDLYLRLSWVVEVDTSKVLLTFEKIKR